MQSILDQSHLAPLTLNIAPVLPDYDHALRLYPLPTCVVLADKYESYRMTYEGCHVLNPGSFVGHSFQFTAYTPATRESEPWYVSLNRYLSRSKLIERMIASWRWTLMTPNLCRNALSPLLSFRICHIAFIVMIFILYVSSIKVQWHVRLFETPSTVRLSKYNLVPTCI